MTQPRLAVRASGFGGRGYKAIFEPGQPVVPSVTTILGALDKPGVVQWAVDNTAAYAVANVDELLDRTEEQGYGFLRWYHKRKPDFDDPDVNLTNYHVGVLDDLAELGTLVHEWIEADLNGWIEPEITRREQEEMIEQYLLWKVDQDITVHATEATLFGNGYAGTADTFWTVNGVKYLNDNKTSRLARDEHFAQLGALGACHTMAVEALKDAPEAVEAAGTWWTPTPLPSFEAYSILHLRPDTEEGPAFCELIEVPLPVVDSAFELFRGALAVRHAQKRLKDTKKEVAFDGG